MYKWYKDKGFVALIVMCVLICIGQTFARIDTTHSRNKAAEKACEGIGEFIALKMEYAYKQGQVDALHGLIKVKVSTNESNKEVWEWTGSPWDGTLKPHSPTLVDAQNDADIIEKLRGEK